MTSSVVGHTELAVRGDTVPEGKTIVDVITVQDGRALSSIVQQASADEIVLTLLPRSGKQPASPEPGTRLELVWKDPGGLLAMLVEVVARERAAEPTLRVRRSGPTAPGQRRWAVRSPLALPVQLIVGKEQLSGLSVDISEGGLRYVLDRPPVDSSEDGDGPVAQATDDGAVQSADERLPIGERVTVVVGFNEAVIRGEAEVVRRHAREDGRVEVSLHFVGLPEVTQDLIRRQVFAALRDLRQRGII